MSAPVWSDDKVDDLKRLLADGLSRGQIAGRIGMSRNAVIGKVARLGISELSAYRPHATTPKPKGDGRQASNIRVLTRGPKAQGKMLVIDDLKPGTEACDIEPDALPPISQRKTLFQLKPHHCRWPYGEPSDPSFFFCGGDIRSGSYCGVHARVASAGRARA